MIKFNMRLIRLVQQLGFLGILFCVAMSARAENLRVDARLVWGSNDTNATLKVADGKLSEDLTRIFKWKNYYQITNCTVSIAPDATQTVDMSAKCRLSIKNLGGDKVEVSCFGEGKLVSKGNYSLADGKWVALAGNDKNDNAWFICVRAKKADEKD